MQTLNLIIRQASQQFNSIETVFNALIPYFKEEFDLRIIELPYRTSGMRSMRRNRKFLHDQKIDGICHLTGHENYLISSLPQPSILTLHDIGAATIGRPLRDKFILHYWFKRPIQEASKVTVISEFSKVEIADRYPLYREKISVVPNPVDDRLRLQEKDFDEINANILFVGTKDNKNLERSIEALQDIDCTLNILGELSDSQSLLLEKYNIEFKNHFGLDYDEVLDLYRQSDLLLFPSLYEGFGIPILEAQGTGRPVITSNIGTMPNTAGDGALFVDPYSVSGITKGVKQVIANKELRDSLVEKGLQNVKQYAAANIAKQYITLYKSLLKEN